MPRGKALRKWRAVLNKRRSGLISGEHYIPALFARHVPQARQMLRKLQDRHMVCEPIMGRLWKAGSHVIALRGRGLSTVY